MGNGQSGSNDGRSTGMNPNNAAHAAATNNHANQSNPSNTAHAGAAPAWSRMPKYASNAMLEMMRDRAWCEGDFREHAMGFALQCCLAKRLPVERLRALDTSADASTTIEAALVLFTQLNLTARFEKYLVEDTVMRSRHATKEIHDVAREMHWVSPRVLDFAEGFLRWKKIAGAPRTVDEALIHIAKAGLTTEFEKYLWDEAVHQTGSDYEDYHWDNGDL